MVDTETRVSSSDGESAGDAEKESLKISSELW